MELQQLVWVSCSRKAWDQELIESWTKARLEAGLDISMVFYKAEEGVLRIGNVEMVVVLEKYMTHPRREMQWLWFYCYNEAIKNGIFHVVRWLLNREGSSLVKWTSAWHKAPLFIALHNCPARTKLGMVQLLLGNGVDPNGRGGLGILQTALQRAIHNRDIEIAMLLLIYGADPITVAKRTAPLHMAFQQGHTAFVQCLFEHGARSRYQFKENRYTLRQEMAVLENMTTLLEELGFDKALIQEPKYLILDQPKGR